MAVEIILPKLGMDMQSGIIMTWYKNEGDTVQKGEPLFELMTDKVNIEVEAEDAGVLLKKYYQTGVELPVFTAIGCIGEATEQAPVHETQVPKNPVQSQNKISEEDRATLRAIRSKNSDGFSSGVKTLRATPSARRLATQNNIDLNEIKGSGPKGRIQVEDVETMIKEPKILQKTVVPQQKVFDCEKKEDQEIKVEVGDTLKEERLNPGTEDLLDRKLEDLVSGISALEAELGSDTQVQENDCEKEDQILEASIPKSVALSPLAEKIADVEKIDITSIREGSGPDGRIMKEDILRAMEKAAMCSKSKIEHVEVIPSLKISEEKSVIAKKKVESIKEIEQEEPPEKVVFEEVKSIETPKAKEQAIPVQEELENKETETNEIQVEAVGAKRQIIADRMVKSNQETAVITLTSEIDMTEVKELRKKISKKVENETGCRCTYTDFLLVSVARALMEHPYINCSLQGDAIILHDYVNLGLAVGMDDGLIVPVITGADQFNFSETVKKRSELIKSVKNKKLTGDHFKGSTFTVTNLGMYGVLEFSAIINQPNSAILSVGEVVDRIRLFKGEPTPRSVMKVSINLDHRVADGMVGAKFLQTVKSYMENPALLLF